MKAGEAARRAGVTIRALRYYERLGLVTPGRGENAYREYEPIDVALVQEIKGLMELGFAVSDTRPFLDCLLAGSARADTCPESLSAYRHAIDDISERIAQLQARREALRECLDAAVGMAAGSGAPPAVLLEPAFATRRQEGTWRWPLVGREMPNLALESTDGRIVRLHESLDRPTVLYLYPLTGSPTIDLPQGWDAIPGVRGCTAEACGFRDHHAELLEAGAGAVFGLSSQDTAYQREVVERLRLPFAMLSDQQLALAQAMGLPTIEAGGRHFFARITMILRAGFIEHAFFPVDDPKGHAIAVRDWLRARAPLRQGTRPSA